MLTPQVLQQIFSDRWIEIAASAWAGYIQYGMGKEQKSWGKGFLLFSEDPAMTGNPVPELENIIPETNFVTYVSIGPFDTGGVKSFDDFWEGLDTTSIVNRYIPERDVVIVIEQGIGLLSTSSLSNSLTPPQAYQIMQKVDLAIKFLRFNDPSDEEILWQINHLKEGGNAVIYRLQAYYRDAQRRSEIIAKLLAELDYPISENLARPSKHHSVEQQSSQLPIKLQAAKEFILSGEFDIARTILNTMQDNQIAQRWLTKLDKRTIQ